MSAAGRLWVLALGVATFLASAKTHGRQLRLERELAGYWHVTFSARNPPWVEALWHRERLILWSLVAVLALLAIGFRVLAPRLGWPLPLGAPGGKPTPAGSFFLYIVLPAIGGFVLAGALGLVRFASAAGVDDGGASLRPADWMRDAVWGSVGWSSLTFGMLAALLLLAWLRPA
jgi:hypothetical protein